MASQDVSTPDSQPTKTTPKDALVMAAILKEMGVTEFEPRIINQMVEFAYRYVTDVVEDARVYASHANRKILNLEDIKLAVSQKLDHSFTSPPPREFLLDIARSRNALPLPLISDRSGVRLPPERYCLTSNNYRVKSTTKKAVRKQSASGSNKGNVKISSIPGNINTQRMTGQLQQQQQLSGQNIVQNIVKSQQPIVAQSVQSPTQFFHSALKRKHDGEDDDYDT